MKIVCWNAFDILMIFHIFYVYLEMCLVCQQSLESCTQFSLFIGYLPLFVLNFMSCDCYLRKFVRIIPASYHLFDCYFRKRLGI